MRIFYTVCFASLCLIALPVEAFAQTSGFVEVQSQIYLDDSPHHDLMVDGGTTREIFKGFAVNTFALLSNGWGEFIAGPECRFGDGAFRIGAWGGVEHGTNAGRLAPRYALSGSVQESGFFSSGFLEVNNDVLLGEDDSGMWYDLVLVYSPIQQLGAGLHLRRPDGLGPRLQWTFGSMQTWASWTPYLPEDNLWRAEHGMAGILFFL